MLAFAAHLEPLVNYVDDTFAPQLEQFGGYCDLHLLNGAGLTFKITQKNRSPAVVSPFKNASLQLIANRADKY